MHLASFRSRSSPTNFTEEPIKWCPKNILRPLYPGPGVGALLEPGYVGIPVDLHVILSCGVRTMTYRLVGILWMMGCLCTPAVAAIRLVPTPGGGFHIVFTTPPSPPAPPPARVPPHPAWLKPSYLLGTWKIVGKWGMTGGEVFPAIRKIEDEQIGRIGIFTKTNMIFTPPFLDDGVAADCAAPPRYTVKVIPIHIRDVVLPKSYLQWSGPPGDYAPYREHKVIELKAECAWRKDPRYPTSFTFQLTHTGELAYGGPGFYLLKKMKPQ